MEKEEEKDTGGLQAARCGIGRRESGGGERIELRAGRLGRGRDGPRQFLGQFEGILQTDGYTAYDQIGGPKMVHAACWSHYPESGLIRSKL